MANCGIIFLTCCCYLFLISSAQRLPFLAVGKNFIWNVSSEGYILQTQSTNPAFACGFHSNGTSYYFSVFMSADQTSSSSKNQTVTVWTANRDKHLDASSILRLSQEGNLELVDGQGDVIWSAGTTDNYKTITAMKLEESGNLVLLDADNGTVWQSFDHPTDTLVARQQLQDVQKLTSYSSSTEASYFVSTKDGDLSAFIVDGSPQMYLQLKDFSKSVPQCTNTGSSTRRLLCRPTEVQFWITFSLYGNSPRTVKKTANHFIKLESDGRLMLYDWNTNENKWVSSELGNPYSDACLYPLKCGRFGVCKGNTCSCPAPPDRETQYFKPSDEEHLEKGCEYISPAPSCDERDAGSLVYFGNYSSFAYADLSAAAANIGTLDLCLEACLNNCSCKAVFFKNDSTGLNCYLFDQVFSIRIEPLYNQNYSSRAFFKVSRLSISQPPLSESQGEGEQHRKRKYAKSIIGIAVGSLAVAVFVAGTIVFLVKRKREEEEDEEEDELDQLPGMMPRRFSYEELKTATEDFQTILGRGGFGCVFGGVLNDGTRIAVKRLDNIGQGMKEFVAEVQTIGSIHHVNLVRLVGFCARKSHRLLVYEYMSNGSLDKWIFHENGNPNLDWKTRQSIIIGTSKGLCYLHEECSHRIAHLDVKPENILLDENYSARLSDFGLSKLISRDQSQVVTTMRGTPGYLAPEWLSASISEKADVYSFGVVVMEVVCGRRNLDLSQPEGSRHLLKLLHLAQENQLLDLVDMTDEERSRDGEEAVRVMRIAMWCLQNDDTRRPPMSLVVKALEGTIELDGHIELDPFYAMERRSASQTQSGSETQSDTQSLLLSGPR